MGHISVSRSFGDHRYKTFVTAQPFLNECDVSCATHTPFLILACDGLWDVMSDDEGVGIVMESLTSDGANDKAARLLVSYTDVNA